MLKNIKKKWDKYTDGWFGNIVYLFLGFIIAYSFNVFLGYTLSTDTPVVAVYSCSMEHDTYNNWWKNCNLSPNEVCGKDIGNYTPSDFDDYWSLCGSWYESKNISKEDFKSFTFSDGLEVGDMIVVMRSENIKVGDIIIFSADTRKIPIIHRVYAIAGGQYLTKGDNNASPDNFAGKQIHGKAIFKIPVLGWVKIIFTQITGIP
ncbi:MAG: signal peptidase I [Candidatus Bathyarchaeota archaeon]